MLTLNEYEPCFNLIVDTKLPLQATQRQYLSMSDIRKTLEIKQYDVSSHRNMDLDERFSLLVFHVMNVLMIDVKNKISLNYALKMSKYFELTEITREVRILCQVSCIDLN